MAAKPPVVWSPEARADLSTIWDYYSSTADPATADDIVRKID
jgi:plasmid stabilization system protein ParE